MNEIPDRELLELAAKAAGLGRLVWWEDQQTYQLVDLPNCPRWNPLTDDGDALRLAVDLNLTLLPIGGGESTGKAIGCSYEFTRRAIVRAAAEIGSQMK